MLPEFVLKERDPSSKQRVQRKMNVSEGKKQFDMGTDWLLLICSLCTTRNVTYHLDLQGRIKSLATIVTALSAP